MIINIRGTRKKFITILYIIQTRNFLLLLRQFPIYLSVPFFKFIFKKLSQALNSFPIQFIINKILIPDFTFTYSKIHFCDHKRVEKLKLLDCFKYITILPIPDIESKLCRNFYLKIFLQRETIPFVASNFPTRETSLNDFKRGVEVSRTLLYSPHLQFKLPIH